MIAEIIVCILAGLGAGLGTGFAGMSAAAVISPMLITFLGMEPYQAIGIALASDVLRAEDRGWHERIYHDVHSTDRSREPFLLRRHSGCENPSDMHAQYPVLCAGSGSLCKQGIREDPEPGARYCAHGAWGGDYCGEVFLVENIYDYER